VTMNANEATTATFSAASKLYQQGNASYTGAWTTGTCNCYSGGTDKFTQASGASASFTFTGSRIQFVSEQSATRGSFRVYLDGQAQTTVSNYNATATNNAVVVWSHTFPTSGKHTLKVVNLATSGHPRLDVDAFVVSS
jgi:Carbohydrate esterase 2 N-terminal